MEPVTITGIIAGIATAIVHGVALGKQLLAWWEQRQRERRSKDPIRHLVGIQDPKVCACLALPLLTSKSLENTHHTLHHTRALKTKIKALNSSCAGL